MSGIESFEELYEHLRHELGDELGERVIAIIGEHFPTHEHSVEEFLEAARHRIEERRQLEDG